MNKTEKHFVSGQTENSLLFNHRSSIAAREALVLAYCEKYNLSVDFWDMDDNHQRKPIVMFNGTLPEDKADEAWKFAYGFVYTPVPPLVKAASQVTLADAVKRFRDEVWNRPDEVDPGQRYTWDGLAKGFLMACGIPLEDITYTVESDLSDGNFDKYL